MKNYSAKEIKNIVLIGAPGSGKTTLAEAMAYEGKVIDRRGAVETNNTLSDNTDIEHEYKRSIYSTILFTEFMERPKRRCCPNRSPRRSMRRPAP